MSTIDTHASSAPASSGALACVADWIGTTDHKRLGRLYLGSAAVAFVGSAVVGVLLGIERIWPDREWLPVKSLTQLFAVERFGLTFLVLLPAMIGAALAIVPLQVGARALALPRLALAGFWLWLFGGVLGVYSLILNGGPGGSRARFVDLFILAVVLVALGALASVGSLVTTVLTTRAPGMNMRRIPYFTWASLVAGVGLVLALPVLVGDLLYLYAAHHYPSAANEMSGNLALTDWAGWGFTQPLTLLFAVPVLGYYADVAATFSGERLRPRGPIFLAIALSGVGAFASVLQATPTLDSGVFHKDFWTVIDQLIPFGLIHGLPLLGAFSLFAYATQHLVLSKPKVQAPAVFGVLSAGLLLAAFGASLVAHIGDAGLAGTTFEEGSWLLTVGAAVVGALGAASYWGPKWSGRVLPKSASLFLSLAAAAGTALAAGGLLVAGFADQPGAVFPFILPGTDVSAVNFDYSGPMGLWNALNVVGLAVLLLTVLAFVALSLRGGEAAGNDPWGGQTLEWATASPAPADNFAELHTVKSAEPLIDLQPNRSDA